MLLRTVSCNHSEFRLYNLYLVWNFIELLGKQSSNWDRWWKWKEGQILCDEKTSKTSLFALKNWSANCKYPGSPKYAEH